MNNAKPAVQWLFLDLNAFFASCEQQEEPALRGKPVIVVQTPTDSAVAIAASYAAKAYDIKTGTVVREARRLCPNVIPVQANHRLYSEYHERILKAVDTCLPVDKVMSIDEMACRLMGTERQVAVSRELALKVKRALRGQVGECLTCSIGIAPNVFLGQVGSDPQKPDGLVLITHFARPRIAGNLRHRRAHGAAPTPRRHLHRCRALAGLADAPAPRVGRHQRLAVSPDAARRRYSRFAKSMGHQHVLEPELRTNEGAATFARHLLTKAAERLRRCAYYCRRLGLHLSWTGDLGGWWDEVSFNETSDTGFLLGCLDQLWPRVPRYKPLSVGVVLLDLVPANAHQPDLFDAARRQKLSPLIDRINDRYGRCAIGFGLMPPDVRAFKGHADLEGIDWVIVGGESGPRARPMDPRWAIDIRNQCIRANVAFFFPFAFDEIGYWSQLKLDIVEQYGAAYTKTFANVPNLKKFYIDGFSGAGIHVSKATGAAIGGSPTRALKVTPPFDGFCFIDLNATRPTICARFAATGVTSISTPGIQTPI
jgi:DNA polymerase IV